MKNNELIKRLLEGDIFSCAKLISTVENNEPEAEEILKRIEPHINENILYLGITGPAGSGKSTILSQLINLILKENRCKIGVLCIDPSSPFSGGALLGDRIRLPQYFTKKEVFIRSMATRGNLGGLAKTTYECAKIIAACGFDYIIIETAGVGQQELDIAKYADIVIVVLQPLIGDDIQLLKAGLIEIADILVINKSDLPAAEELFYELKSITEDKIDTILTSAINNRGIEELWSSIKNFVSYLKETNLISIRKKNRIKEELIRIIKNRIIEGIKIDQLEKIVEDIFTKKIDLYSAADKIIKKITM